jgi:hypothetical protein
MTGWSSLPIEVAASIFEYFGWELIETYQDMIFDFLQGVPLADEVIMHPLRDYSAIIRVSRSFHRFITSVLTFGGVCTLPESLLLVQYEGVFNYSRQLELGCKTIFHVTFLQLVRLFGRFWRNSDILGEKNIFLRILSKNSCRNLEDQLQLIPHLELWLLWHANVSCEDPRTTEEGRRIETHTNPVASEEDDGHNYVDRLIDLHDDCEDDATKSVRIDARDSSYFDVKLEVSEHFNVKLRRGAYIHIYTVERVKRWGGKNIPVPSGFRSGDLVDDLLELDERCGTVNMSGEQWLFETNDGLCTNKCFVRYTPGGVKVFLGPQGHYSYLLNPNRDVQNGREWQCVIRDLSRIRESKKDDDPCCYCICRNCYGQAEDAFRAFLERTRINPFVRELMYAPEIRALYAQFLRRLELD